MSLARTALVFVLSASVAASPIATLTTSAAFAQQAQQNTNLSDLTQTIESLNVRLISAIRRSEAPELALNSESGKPVLAALQDLNEATGRLANGAALQDESFHKAMGDVVGRTAATTSALELTGAKDQTVTDALDKLISAVRVLQDNYSKTAARQRQGGNLSEAELAKLNKIRANQAELQDRLNAMESKVEGNTRAIESLREVRRRSEAVSNSGNDLASFLAAMVALRIIDGLLWGSHWYWGPWGGWYSGYSIEVINIHNEIWIDIDYSWDYYAGLEIEIEDADFDLDLDDADLIETQDFLDSTEINLEDGLDAAVLEGIDDFIEAELNDPGLADLELDDADLVDDLKVDLEIDLGALGDGDRGDLDRGDLGDLGAGNLGGGELLDIGSDDFSGGDMDFGGMDGLGGDFDF